MGTGTDGEAVDVSEAALAEHARLMGPAYRERFPASEVRAHAAMLAGLSASRLCRVVAEPDPDAIVEAEGTLRVTVAGFDLLGELSVICGLLSAEGFTIVDGAAFTAADPPPPAKPARAGPAWWRNRSKSAAAGPPLPKRKIIDVFRVRPLTERAAVIDWSAFESRLNALLAMLLAGDRKAAREALAEPVCATLRRFAAAPPALLPLEVSLERTPIPPDDAVTATAAPGSAPAGPAVETLLRIEGADTPAFLFQFLTALAMRGVDVRRMEIGTRDGRVRDVLSVAETDGTPVDPARRGTELRAAVALVKQFTHMLPACPDPPMALRNFGAFLDDLLSRPGWERELSDLQRPDALSALARLMGVSEFLWEDFLRLQHDHLLPMVTDAGRLGPRMTLPLLKEDLLARLAGKPDIAAKVEALNAWKDRQMFRIDMRHILGRAAGFAAFSAEMSDLAETAVSTLFDLLVDEVAVRHGRPRLAEGRECRLCLAALGKTGGREMGVASDVELMFLYEGDGRTDGAHPITNAEFAAGLATAMMTHLRARREGIFEVDLRLRPFGETGPLGVALDSFASYYGPGGPAPNLQRQALIRLRPIAGEPDFCREVVAVRDRVLFEGPPLDAANIRHLRTRQAEELVPKGKVNAKFSAGGLVDIEYTVQALQARHARRRPDRPELRSPSTLVALEGLRTAGLLDDTTALSLREAYLFLRRLIDAMRIVRGHAKDVCLPPADSGEFAFLARRMGYSADGSGRGSDRSDLAADLGRHMGAVRRLVADIFRLEFPEALAQTPAHDADASKPSDGPARGDSMDD
jgi:glutamate-ammonia-ligase adenylyltransferase